MSGRPYARNLRAPFVGATDLDAVLPHTFCISILRSTSSPKERAIRRFVACLPVVRDKRLRRAGVSFTLVPRL